MILKKLDIARKKVMLVSTLEDTTRLENKDIVGVSFDGRKDMTISYIPDPSGVLHPRLIKEHHISVTLEPKGEYLGHVTPEEPGSTEKPAKKKLRQCMTY